MLVLAIHGLSLVAFSLITLDGNRPYLLHGLDGGYVMTVAKQQQIWTNVAAGFTNNFFQSIGNIWFPTNTLLIPGYAFSQALNHGEVDPLLAYSIFTIELFAGVFVLGTWLRQNWLVSAIASWALVLLVLPYWGKAAVYPIFEIVPHAVTSIAWTLVALVLFGSVGTLRIGQTAAFGAALLGVLFYLVVSQPATLVLAGPALAVFGLFLALDADSRRERKIKLLVAVILLVASFAIGMPQFLAGIFKFTAATEFASRFVTDRAHFYYASIAFHGDTFGVAGPLLFGFGISGGVLVTIRGKGKARTVAIATLSYATMLITVGVAAVYIDLLRSGPAPLYFELFLWPFYAVYAAIFLRFLFEIAANALRPLIVHRMDLRLAIPNRVRKPLLIVGMACVPWLFLVATHGLSPPILQDFRYPPALTPIVAVLRNEIGLKPGEAFRGRVATLTGLRIPKAISWMDLIVLDFALDREFGNDHRSVGFWYYDIPTLFEYNQSISPAFFLLATTFLARPEDRQQRNVISLRQFEPKLLQMLGVRFVITDIPLQTGARFRLRMPKGDDPKLYLYEIDQVNVGNFSPTQHRVVKNAKEALMGLARPDFNAREQVLSNIELPDKLTRASASTLVVEPGKFHLSALTDGLSVIVLPIEYSHCLEIQEREKTATSPQLFRANLLQTGILFRDRLDATLTYFTGPLHNSSCRLADARDMKRLDILGAAGGQNGL